MTFRRIVAMVAVLLAAFALTACDPNNAASELEKTYNARQCIIDHESRYQGMYVAEYGGTPSGDDGGTAAGAYQFVNLTWFTVLPLAEGFFKLRLTDEVEDALGARRHASFASPYAQDLVAAYTLIHKPQGQVPWTYPECYAMIGQEPVYREDGPVNEPPQFIAEQIEAFMQSQRDLIHEQELLAGGIR